MTLYKGNDNQSTYALIKTGTKLTHKKNELVQNFTTPLYTNNIYVFHDKNDSQKGGYDIGDVINLSSTNCSIVAAPINYLDSIKNADSWEIIIKATYIFRSGVRQNLLVDSKDGNFGYYGFGIDVLDNKFRLKISNSSSATSVGVITSDSLINATTYYIKALFTGTYYELLISQDGVNYTSCGILETPEKITTITGEICLGNGNGSNTGWLGTLHLKDTNLKINGELVWFNKDENNNFLGLYKQNSLTTSTYVGYGKRYVCFTGSAGLLAIPMPVSNFTDVMQNASSWKIQIKFFYTEPKASTNYVILAQGYYQGLNNASRSITNFIFTNASGNLYAGISNNFSSSNIGTITGTSVLRNYSWNTVILEFTGDTYNLYLIDDEGTETLEGSVSSTTKITLSRGMWAIGGAYNQLGGNVGRAGSPFTFDLQESFFIADNEYIWQGVKEGQTTFLIKNGSQEQLRLTDDFYLSQTQQLPAAFPKPYGTTLKGNIFVGHNTWELYFKVLTGFIGAGGNYTYTYQIFGAQINNVLVSQPSTVGSNPILYFVYAYINSTMHWRIRFTPYKDSPGNYPDMLPINNNITLSTANSIFGNTDLEVGKILYIKVAYDGTQYLMFLSDDGINYTQEGNALVTDKNLGDSVLLPSKLLTINSTAYNNSTQYDFFHMGVTFMKDCYLESEGVKYWFNQYAENVYEDYTDYHLITKGNTQF